MEASTQLTRPTHGETTQVALENTESLSQVKSLLYYQAEEETCQKKQLNEQLTHETLTSTPNALDSQQQSSSETLNIQTTFVIDNSPINATENFREKNTQTYFEVYDENESGLSWGKKIAHDQTWQERWLQQQLPKNDENTQTVFGRASGVNSEFCQRWTSSWETKIQEENKIQTVKKKVQKFDSNSFENLVEEWNEDIVNETQTASSSSQGDDWSRRQSIQKRGYDRQAERYWTESTCKTFFFDDQTETDNQNQKCDDSNITEENQERVEYKEYFCEQFVNINLQRTRRVKRGVDGTYETQTILEKQDDNDNLCVQKLEEKQYNLSNGDAVTEKKEKNERGDEISHKIIKHNNSDGGDLIETSIETKITVEGAMQETKRYKHVDGTIHCVRTESVSSKNNKHEEVKDEWWTKPNGESWGLKTAEVSKTKQSPPEHQEFEKWYNDTKEKVVDSWAVDTQYDDSGNPVFVKRFGKKEGDRYTDGTKWGEKWSKTFEPGETTEENSDITQNDSSQQQENQPPPTFLLRVNFYDRWWKEPSGNQWGEKKRVDLKEETEDNEHWYDNGVEKQVDRWSVDKDGTRYGEKFGEKIHGQCEWKENWSQNSNNESQQENFYIDKNWKEYQDGKVLKWGEKQGREGEKQWNCKWRSSEDGTSNTGTHWEEAWDDDGLGNFQICSKGNEWVNGETVNWFYNKHGECLGTSEKWAVKKGGNSSGDVWTEKWNETPTEKFAEKEGKNTEGDEWHEVWKESVTKDGISSKWAKKTGRNNKGEEWLESWWEDQHHKQAKKTGKNNSEHWQEEWGEQMNPDGSGEKWTSKWTEELHSGNRRGQNWGDKWGTGGIGGHHWDEKWFNEDKQAYSYDIPSRPEGC